MHTLSELKAAWHDHPDFHREIHESFCEIVNGNPKLKAHRDWVEQNIFGFGERSFLWMWWLIIQEMPQEFTFMEIGVFRGQILSLVRLIADMQGKKVTRYGVTPMSTNSDAGENKNWESDYKADIEKMHDQFNIEKDYIIIHGLSTDPEIIKEAQKVRTNILYVDGAHDYESVSSDYINYTSCIETNGYLVCDDACNDMKMPFGYFQGQESCTKATVDFMHMTDRVLTCFEFVGNVVHNRIYKMVV